MTDIMRRWYRNPTILTATYLMICLADLKQAPDEHSLLVGKTGQGKSFLAAQLLPTDRRLAIIDPKRLFKDPFGLPVFESPEPILKRKIDSFVYRPSKALFANEDAYDDVYDYLYSKGDVFVYSDDMTGIIKGNRYPDMLQACYMLGRELHVTMMSSVQRPANIPLFLATESAHFNAFRLSLDEDIRRVRSWVPGYEPSDLPRFHFYHYNDRTMLEDAEICVLKG